MELVCSSKSDGMWLCPVGQVTVHSVGGDFREVGVGEFAVVDSN